MFRGLCQYERMSLLLVALLFTWIFRAMFFLLPSLWWSILIFNRLFCIFRTFRNRNFAAGNRCSAYTSCIVLAVKVQVSKRSTCKTRVVTRICVIKPHDSRQCLRRSFGNTTLYFCDDGLLIINDSFIFHFGFFTAFSVVKLLLFSFALVPVYFRFASAL